jgi:hypothetical protein
MTTTLDYYTYFNHNDFGVSLLFQDFVINFRQNKKICLDFLQFQILYKNDIPTLELQNHLDKLIIELYRYYSSEYIKNYFFISNENNEIKEILKQSIIKSKNYFNEK